MREVLFITRPLIYVLLIRKYGIRSWIPWLISLAMDIIGAGVLSQDTLLRVSRGDKRIPVSVAEKDEVMFFGFFLFLPFFESLFGF